jgi:hypothetical protein
MERLRQVLNGDASIVRRATNTYLSESERLMRALRVVWDADDTEALAQTSRNLKSCSGNVGTLRVRGAGAC